MPLTGYSGELLWRLLGVSRHECYVTNVRKDYSDLHTVPTPAEIDEALPLLRAELATTQANIIVALGNQALYALTGKTSIETWRGTVLPCTLLPGRKVLGTYHTAAALRQYPWTFIIEHDLRRARRESLYPHISYPKRDFLIDAPLGETVEYLDGLGEYLSVDIETIGMETIACVGISDRADRAICIPFIGGRLSPSELAYVWRRLYHKFYTSHIIGQNIQFDLTRLERYGFRFPNIYFDTMLAHHLLYPEFDHDLGFITSIYTREPYYKHEISTNLWPYNCKDAACTFEAYEGLLKELKQYGQLEYFNNHVMSLIRPVMKMQDAGFVIDKPELHRVKRRYELERDLLQLRLEAIAQRDLNVKSGPQMREFLYQDLGLPVKKLTKKAQAPAVDEETLRTAMFDNPDHAPVLKTVLDVLERRTMLSGFLNLETSEDGRYKANYLIHGTKSGRLSSRGRGKGPQLQNIPLMARRMFVASPGHALLQGDLKRAEAMFVAFDSESMKLRELYTNDAINPYCEFASDTMGFRVTKKDEVLYKTFKQVTHASNYGMAWKKLIAVLRLAGVNIEDIPIKGVHGGKRKAEFLIESYHRAFPEIRHVWHRRIRELVRPSRAIHDAFGRRRLFLDRMDEDLYRKAFAQRPQSSIVTVANIGVCRLIAKGYTVVAQVHDSIVTEVPEEDVQQALVDLNDAMTTPITNWGGTFTIPVELKIGYSWGGLYEVDLESAYTGEVRELLGGLQRARGLPSDEPIHQGPEGESGGSTGGNATGQPTST